MVSDLEVLGGIVTLFGVLGWIAAGKGWVEGSLSVKVVPLAKRKAAEAPKDEERAA